MTKDDLGRVLAWRNHPTVRKFMYTQHQITPTEHQRWFECALDEKGKYLLIFEKSGVPLGFVQFIRGSGVAAIDWGFYTSPKAPKGMGRILGRTALHYAFTKLCAHKVCGQVRADNIPSRQLHLALGFEEEGLLREHCYDGDMYHDVVCFGLREKNFDKNL